MKKGVLLVFMIFLVFPVVLAFNEILYYDDGDYHADYAVNPPVHQYLSYQSYLLLDEEVKAEFENYIGSEVECIENSCGDVSIGSTITEGAYEEDLVGRWMEHFLDPDTGDGLAGWDSADEKARELYNFSIVNYFNESTRNLSFYYLGRTAHILEDMGVPAHANLDIHSGIGLCDGDDYENYISGNYLEIDTRLSEIVPIEPTTISTLIYSLAEFSDNFDSDDVDGEVDRGRRRQRDYISGSGIDSLMDVEHNSFLMKINIMPSFLQQKSFLFA